MTDIKTALPKPWGYARNVDGRIQISVGPDRPPCNERGSGYFTPWAAMYGGDMMIAYAERAVLEAAPASSAMAMQAVDEWLPIESAPKDGTFILLGSKEGAWVARYQPVYQSGYKPENPWQSMMLNHDHMPRHDRSKPTHWKPLTAPVQASDAGRQG